MWALSFLPNWIFYVMLFGGLIGLLISRFLPIYKTIVQVASAAFFVGGVYMAGAIGDNDAWVARVKEMELKVAAAAVESAQENTRIVEKTIVKTQIVQQRGADVIKYIDREVVKYDTKFAPGGECEIPKEFVQAHNKAAEGPK